MKVNHLNKYTRNRVIIYKDFDKLITRNGFMNDFDSKPFLQMD